MVSKSRQYFPRFQKPGNVFETKCDFKIQALFSKRGWKIERQKQSTGTNYCDVGELTEYSVVMAGSKSQFWKWFTLSFGRFLYYLTCNGRRFRYYMMVRSWRKATLWWKKILFTNKIFHKWRKVKRTAKFNICAHFQAIWCGYLTEIGGCRCMFSKMFQLPVPLVSMGSAASPFVSPWFFSFLLPWEARVVEKRIVKHFKKIMNVKRFKHQTPFG